MSFPIVNGIEVAVPPPEGYVVDFDNPEIDVANVNATIILFAIEYTIASVFFGQRMYTNAVLLRSMKVDDCQLAVEISAP